VGESVVGPLQSPQGCGGQWLVFSDEFGVVQPVREVFQSVPLYEGQLNYFTLGMLDT
jgi:hypothetical protein